VLDDSSQLREIARGPKPSTRLNRNTSLSFRMDSLSVDNVHLLWGGRGRPSVQRRQKSGFSRTLLQRCSGLIDHTGIVIGMDRNRDRHAPESVIGFDRNR